MRLQAVTMHGQITSRGAENAGPENTEPENAGPFNYLISRQLRIHNVLRILGCLASESVHVSRPSTSSRRYMSDRRRLENGLLIRRPRRKQQLKNDTGLENCFEKYDNECSFCAL